MPLFTRLGSPLGGIYIPAATAPPPGDLYQVVVDATNAVPFANSLKGHWEFNSTLADRSGGGHNGTLGAGSEVYVDALPADSNNAFNCNGVNWVSVAHHADLKPAVGSIMAWCKPFSVHNGIIAACNTTGVVDDHFELRVNNTQTVSCFFQINSVTTLLQTNTAYYGPNQTIHIVVTWNASGVSLYLDGNHIQTDTGHTTGLTNNTLAWRFGTNGLGSTLFDGVIDEIAIWNRVLTRTEIEALAQIGPPS